MLKVFKIVAILEGFSYLFLLFNMVFIKPIDIELYKKFLFPIGMSHGILFMGYILFAVLLKNAQKWDLKNFFIIVLASFIPFGTFYVDRKYLKN